MTLLDRATSDSEPSHGAFRLAIVLLAALLGAQCIWLLLAELRRPGIDRLPTDTASATAAAQQRDDAIWTASIGGIRGDLWADSAFTFASLVVGEKGASASPAPATTLARARASLGHALDDAPTQSGAWLLLADLTIRFPRPGSDATPALKMSYYTGPSEQYLIPMRLRMAVQANKIDDFEIRQFISRDIRLLLAQKQNTAIIEAYGTASPEGKRDIEQVVGDFDPSFVNTLRGSGSAQQLPN
jgi:hypothetical protein